MRADAFEGDAMNHIMELKDLSFMYGQGTPFEKKAVDNLSLHMEQGEFIGIIGHTGSGKSTLVQMLNGLLKPTRGQILLDGHDIWNEPKKIREVRFRVGMVFQYPEYQLFEDTVYKDIAFGAINKGLTRLCVMRRILRGCMKICLKNLPLISRGVKSGVWRLPV